MSNYSDISLTWFGDVTSNTGQAQYARALLEPLIKNGAHVKIEPVNSGATQADLQPFWHEVIPRSIRNQPGIVKISHCQPKQATPNIFGGPSILLAHWDTLGVPVSWVEDINKNFTQLWTSNMAAVTTGVKDIKIPTDYIPMPVEADTVGDVAELVDVTPQTTVFGFTGPWDNRSNISDLVIAYCAEFSVKDDVALVLKTGGKNPADPNTRNQILGLIRDLKKTLNKPNLPPVVVLQDQFSQNAMDAIIRRFNIYVSTSRGQSVNVTLTKCLAMGKQCIAPNAGPMYDYANTIESPLMYPIRYFSEPVIQMGEAGNPADRWIRPDLHDTMSSMRRAYFNRLIKKQEKASQKLTENMLSLYGSDVIVERLAGMVRNVMPFKVKTLA